MGLRSIVVLLLCCSSMTTNICAKPAEKCPTICSTELCLSVRSDSVRSKRMPEKCANLHNYGMVLKGYDIYLSDPFGRRGGKRDPGWRHRVFKYPDAGSCEGPGITLIKSVQCDGKADRTMISSTEQYVSRMGESSTTREKEKFGTEFKAKVKGVGADVPLYFEQGIESSSVADASKKFFQEERGVMFFQNAKCIIYGVDIMPSQISKFSDGFVKHVWDLGMASDNEAIKEQQMKFLRIFGTHYSRKTYMGSRLAVFHNYRHLATDDGTLKNVKDCEMRSQTKNAVAYLKQQYNEKSCIKRDKHSISNAEITENVIYNTWGTRLATTVEEWHAISKKTAAPVDSILISIHEMLSDKAVFEQLKDNAKCQQLSYDFSHQTLLDRIADANKNYCDLMKDVRPLGRCNRKEEPSK